MTVPEDFKMTPRVIKDKLVELQHDLDNYMQSPDSEQIFDELSETMTRAWGAVQEYKFCKEFNESETK